MPGEIIKPGPSLVQAAQALATIARGLGRFAYQWIFPGPSARPVIAEGVIAPAAIGSVATVISYQVPTGERFVLDAVVFNFVSGTSWVEGSGDLLFTLTVKGAGTRPVEWMQNVKTRRGSTIQPYPVPKRLEFNQRDVLTITCRTVANVDDGFLVGQIIGHTYPNSEAE